MGLGLLVVMSGRQRFSPEFKAIAVEEVVEKNRMIADVAREMKVLPGTLGNWVCRYRERHPVVEEPLSLSERAELASDGGPEIAIDPSIRPRTLRSPDYDPK